MPVKIACPKCSKKYTLPDSAVGKAVKCKACETTFRTRKPAAAPTSAQPPNPAAQQKPAKPKPVQPKPAQPVSPNLDEFGIDGGFQQQADIFGSPPQANAGLDNFGEQDPFGEAVDPIVVGPAGAAAAPANPYQSVLNNSSMRGSAARKKARKKKRGKASADVSAYGVVRIGMMCVFGASGLVMLATFAAFIIAIVGPFINGAAMQAGSSTGLLGTVLFLLSMLAFILVGLGSLVMMVGQIMCMFAPNGNERFNSIGAGALVILAMVVNFILSVVVGVALVNVGSSGQPVSQETVGSIGIGYLVVTLICGAMVVAAMFMFVNFYRRVGQNIKSDALVKVSTRAIVAFCIYIGLGLGGAAISFLLGVVGADPQTIALVIGGFVILNSLFSLVFIAMIMSMVWTGISSLSN